MPAARRFTVATHGYCFDGMASAALFTALHRAVEGSRWAYNYRSCIYGPRINGVPAAWLDGEDNAILDYRYTPNDKLGWYFDHHVTAFATPEVAAASIASADDTLARPGPAPLSARHRVYQDGAYGSCTKLIADVAKARFGFDLKEHADLVAWADIIDTAGFSSAEAATRVDEPALVLATVVEQKGGAELLGKLMPVVLEGGIAAAAESPLIRLPWGPIAEARARFAEQVAKHGQPRGRVLVLDLGDEVTEVPGKFFAYAQFPACVYTVTVLRTKQQLKLSIGYNPWSTTPRSHDIAAICRRYGGGGHPVVGGASFGKDELERLRGIVDEIAAELER